MKKIANTSLWGKIAMVLNAVLLILIVIIGVQLKKYDGLNKDLQNVKPQYTAIKDSIARFERAVYVTEKKIANNESVKSELEAEVNSLNAKIAAEKKNKKAVDSLKLVVQDRNGQIQKQVSTTKDDSTSLALIKDTLSAYQEAFVPVESSYNQKMQTVVPALKSFNTVVLIAIIIFIVKIIFLAYWMASNMDNVYKLSPWMHVNRKSADGFDQPSPFALKFRQRIQKIRYSKAWSVIGWFIPVYNLFKPCSTFNEMLSETNTLLRDKSILAETKDAGQMESVGFWWGAYLFAKVLMSLVVGGIVVCFNFWFLFALINANTAALDMGMLSMGTFFGVKGLFCYINHTTVLVLFIIGWVVYLCYECYMVFSYNKLNKLLVENESKFDISDEVK